MFQTSIIKGERRASRERRRQMKEGQRIMGFGYGQGRTFKTLEKPELNEITPSDISMSAIEKDSSIDVEVKMELHIPVNIFQRMFAYCKLVDEEINGLGAIEQFEKNKFRITEIYLLKQKVSGTSCEIETSTLAEFLQKLIKEKKDTTRVKLWWHSHNKMSCGWSTTDEITGRNIAGKDYFLSLVINHDGEMRCRMNLYRPIEITIDSIPIHIETPLVKDNKIEKYKKEVENLVQIEKTEYIKNEKEESPVVIDEGEGEEKNLPMGKRFVHSGIEYTWNVTRKRYYIFDIFLQQEISDMEAFKIIGIDYNSPMFLNQEEPV